MEKPELRNAAEYQALGRQYKYRYVNYRLFLEELKEKIPAENTRDFLTKEKKIYSDPVIDPRETWKQWFARTIDFKDPPLVERSELPGDLQPQNQKLGKVRHFFTRMTLSPMTQVPHFNPVSESVKD